MNGFRLTTQTFENRPILSIMDFSSHTQGWGTEGGDFLILAAADEEYIQIANTGSGFMVEKREGSVETHQFAARPSADEKPPDPASAPAMFSRDEALRIVEAYLANTRYPNIVWHSSKMTRSSPVYGIIFLLVALFAILAIVSSIAR